VVRGKQVHLGLQRLVDQMLIVKVVELIKPAKVELVNNGKLNSN